MPAARVIVRMFLIGVLAMSGQNAASEPAAESLDGQWGGDRVQVVIGATGGRVEMDCASGTIDGPIVLSKVGTFVAAGTFEQLHSGPQRADEATRATAARFSGEVSNGVMKLAIQTAGAPAEQKFVLRKGVRVKLLRCL
jgi:hypothetical protein